MNKKRQTLAEDFSATIIESIKSGTAPWQRPWNAGEFVSPFNPISGTKYKGINTVMLARHGFNDPRWMTFKQANEKGYRVKKGAKAQPVEFWQWTAKVPVIDDNGKPVLDEQGQKKMETVNLENPRFHLFYVFHAGQLQTSEGLEIPAFSPPELSWNPLEKGEAILADSGAKLFHDQRNRAFYNIGSDEIHLPPPDKFPEPGHYYSTALHELGHWTRHPTRMSRESGPFGTEDYAREELRAEIASWMLSQELGLPHQPDQSVSYVDGWVSILKKDPFEIMRACRDAEKIKEYIMSMQKELTPEQETTNPGLFVISGENLYFEYSSAREAGAAFQECCSKDENSGWFCEYFSDESKDESILIASRALEIDNNKIPVLKFHQSSKSDLLDIERQFLDGYHGTESTIIKPEMDSKPVSIISEDFEKITTEKTYLNVSYSEKNKAKAAGAKWDRDKKLWYAPVGVNLADFSAWLTTTKTAELNEQHSPVLPPLEEFKAAIQQLGLIVDSPLMDGKIHRVPVEHGKANANDGAYCGYFDGRPNGWVKNFKSGAETKWIATGHVLTPEQKAILQAESAENLQVRSQEKQEEQARAMKRAYAKWMTAKKIENHPFLTTKQVKNYGLREDRKGNLLVPCYDLETGRLRTLQWITPDGVKGFEKDCPQKNTAFIIPAPAAIKNDVLISESYSTGATLHMATGLPVVISFGAHNLKSVAETIRKQYPSADICICADNDHHLTQNIGVIKAREAAESINATFLSPGFTTEEKNKGFTDYNDLYRSRDLLSVEKQLVMKNNGVER